MPRKRNKVTKEETPAELEPGTIVPRDSVPDDVLANFQDADDETEGDSFPGSEFIDGVGQHLDQTPDARAALPLPVVRAQTNAGMPSAPPETFDPTPARAEAPPEIQNELGEYVVESQPTAPKQAQDGMRNFLTWIVTEVLLKTGRTSSGMLTSTMHVTAMLAAVRVAQVPVAGIAGQAETKEPAMEVTNLFAAPVPITLPLWLFSPDKQRRPDTLSLADATSALVTMFSAMPFQMILPAPIPRALAALPKWYRAELAKGGAVRQ